MRTNQAGLEKAHSKHGSRFDHLSLRDSQSCYSACSLSSLSRLGHEPCGSGPLGCNCATYALARDRATERLFSCLSSAAFPNRLSGRTNGFLFLPGPRSRTKDHNYRRILTRHSILPSRDSIVTIPCILIEYTVSSTKEIYGVQLTDEGSDQAVRRNAISGLCCSAPAMTSG